MSCTRPRRIKMLGKDSSHSFGMTMHVISNEVRDPSLIPFSKEDTKSTKCKVLIVRKLRVLRALRGEQCKLNLAHYPNKSLKNLKIKKFCHWDFEFCLELRRQFHGVA